MKSPFPGMDPYIEDYGLWADFHTKLLGEIERVLAAAVPDRYFVQAGERSYVVLAGTDGKEERPFTPDVGLATAVAEPDAESGAVTMRAFIDEPYRENFIEIYEADPEPRLVTCVEVLSPANKRPGLEGWDLYLRKRNALMLGAANFVEIDLLRGGRRMPMVQPWPNSPYYLLVSWKWRAPSCRVWPASFRRPLPELTVPLSGSDPDLKFPLQPMVDAIYARSRYARRFDYARPPAPPLGPDEDAWLAERLRGDAPPTPARPARPARKRRK